MGASMRRCFEDVSSQKNAGTIARREYDLETAQIICGHSSKTTTERFYAEQNIQLAVQFAEKYG